MTYSAATQPDAARSTTSGRVRLALAVILALHFALAALYAVTIPPWNAPDEPAHFNYVRDLSRGQLPVLEPGDWDAARLEDLKSRRFPASESIDEIRYEGHQPPLYYALLAPIERLVGGMSVRDQAVILRLATALIGTASIGVLILIARALAPDRPLLWVAAAGLAAVIPMRVGVAATISNDVLAEIVVGLALWLGIREISGRSVHPVWLGLVIAAALLTKLGAYIVVGLVPLAVLLGPMGNRFRRLVIVGLVAAAGGGWWFVRNAVVYGWLDPLGQRRHNEVVVGQPLTGAMTPDRIADLARTAFHSFWGQFGWMGVLLDERLYLMFAGLSVLVLFGLFLAILPGGGFWRLERWQWRAIGLLAAAVALTGLGILGYNLTYEQPQGRYLYPALASLAIGAAAGLSELLRRRRYGLIVGLGIGALAALDVAILYRYILPDLTRIG